ncbi:exosortase F system-associated membrane protein [Croceimicrobium hydrocarbonivorans]|uniref:Exosortase F system-associated protein n=1 Tax=Croceimicrobium hydrocarbonivorans TaxID=2761580 RepID=A0A7H0VGG7_9FLAO|nr:exosortase F system-associated protein [Croceimicrobium hydrocarbonivorans]QNR24815.1 exosortase F system-associated protein [Croceimicrobium hydrocarbonivorans]
MLRQILRSPKRLLLLLVGCLGLFLVYFFQHYLDFYHLFQGKAPQELNYSSDFIEVDPRVFSVNKVIRYLLNDLFAMALISALFPQGRYVRFALFVLMFGLFILVPIYLWLYLSQPVGFSSLIGHLHRLVMNPVLMMLLIPAFFYQKRLIEEQVQEP